MKLYSVDVKIYATAYIMADTEDEAREISKDMKYDCLEVEGLNGDIEISGKDFASLEDSVSLSPAMTVHGPDDDASFEEVHDYGDRS